MTQRRGICPILPKKESLEKYSSKGEWQNKVDNWIKEYKASKDPSYDIDNLPRPHLRVKGKWTFDLVKVIGKDVMIPLELSNEGNSPSWMCYVEMYEGPITYTSPLKNFEIRGRVITTIHPGEVKMIEVPYVRKKQSAQFVGICFDPLLDPKTFQVVEQYNRQITGAVYFQ